MTDAARSPVPAGRPPLTERAAVAAAVVVAALAAGYLAAVAAAALPPPRLDLLAGSSLAIRVHVAAAVLSLLIGAGLLWGPKGVALHRAFGWGWIVLMAVTALSSLFITELRPGSYSFIHLFAGWTLISLPLAVWAARTHRVHIHRRVVAGVFLGGLIVAGGLTFLPGRLMWAVFAGG